MKKRFQFILAVSLSLILVFGLLPAWASNRNSESPNNAISEAAARAKSNALSRRSRSVTSTTATQSISAIEGQTSTLLPDGRTLIIGGEGADGPLASIGIKDQHTGVATPLPNELLHARAWHTATLLPDGTVLILGGVGSNGQVVESVEIFDPETQSSQLLRHTGLSARAYHTATLLTEGRVLIFGGITKKGKVQKKAQIFDPTSRTSRNLKAAPITARYGHNAKLLADGTVLLWGGTDNDGKAIDTAETYDPNRQRFTRSDTDINLQSEIRNPELAASLPEDGATSVSVDSLIALRFSNPLRVDTVNIESVNLIGPYGAVPITVVPAEAGMLAFITARAPLVPGATYTLSLAGQTDDLERLLISTSITFTTAGGQLHLGEPTDDEEWIPDATNLDGDWESHRPESAWRSIAARKAPSGVTALAGQALRLNGRPLANVTFHLEGTDAVAQTDSTGRFLLYPVPAGHQVMTIDAGTANKGKKTYGMFCVGVDLIEGETNVLPYTIWMPVIDTEHATYFESPTNKDIVAITPLIPGMEVHIPSNTVIQDMMGNAATSISITPIPIDRPPFPLPKGINFPIYFTLQPGAAKVMNADGSQGSGIRLYFPNTAHYPAGSRIDFWSYDPKGVGWFIYGQGTANGNQVLPDPAVAIHTLTCASLGNPIDAPTTGPPPGNCAKDGDPVDLATGLFLHEETDLILPDILPIALTRTYRPNDAASRPFGKGATHPYEMFLVGDQSAYTYADLLLPDGGRIRYNRISPGTSATDALMEHTATPTGFYKSKLIHTDSYGGWDLKLKDGTVYEFIVYGAAEKVLLRAIQDRYGNRLTVVRDSNRKITKINSPSGRWIEFSYDGSNRITLAKDNIGRVVSYTYDASGRLWKVTDANGGVKEFTYDTSHRMLTVKDARGIVHVTNEFDANGRVARQIMADGGVYEFTYTLDANGKVVQTEVTDPRGNLRRVTFNSSSYTLTDARAVGKPEQQAFTYQRQTGTNLILSKTDPLGRTTAYTYDGTANVLSETRLSGTPDAVTTTWIYEATFSQITSVTDPLDHNNSYGYDSEGNLTSATNALGKQNTFAYNTTGQLVSVTDPLSNTTQLTYDFGDLVAVTDSLGQTITAFIDAAGRTIAVTNALGESTRYDYDALNRVTGVNDPLGGLSVFTYDANSNLLTITDPRNNVTSYSYDNMDRLASRTDPLLHTESFQYDLAGNLKQFTDRRGKVTTFNYDALDRRTFAGFGTVTNGQMTTYESTISYTYDGSLPCGCGGPQPGSGRLSQVVDSISGTISYTYDNLDRVTNETSPEGIVNYGYDAANRRTSMTVAGQLAVNYAYDAAGRLTEISQGSSIVSVEYDDADRRTSLTLPNGVVQQYTYDAASRLTEITYKKGADVLGDLSYEHDAAGNRTKTSGSYARTGLPQPVSSASYSLSNQQTAFGGQTLAYDLNGNLTNDGTNTYNWDARNQLLSMTGPGWTASFQYDGLSRRISKTINGITTNFIYDQENAVQEQVGGSPSANILAGLGVDEFFTRSDSSGTSGLLTDGLGSTIALTNSAGSVQTQYTYEAFGKTTIDGTASSNPSQYTGRENDGTGLYYYRARYYSPALQRFISEDPMGIDGGDTNLYAYVGNDPINSIDPLGLERPSRHTRTLPSQYRPMEDKSGCLSKCLLENYGLGLAGGTGIALGSGTLEKPFQVPGSSSATSVASKFLSWALPQRLPFRVWSPTFTRPFALTPVLGRVLGRWIPIAGWGLLFYDMYKIEKCAKKCGDECAK